MNVFYSMWFPEEIIFDKSLSLLWDSFNRHILSFFKTSFLKKVRIISILSPQCSDNNGEVLIPKFQHKTIVY